MTTGLQIRKAIAADIQGMKSLFNAHTSPPKSSYFFQWWNAIPSITYCAEEAGEIVGMCVVLRRKLNNNLNCGVLMGLLVDIPWRGKGLFKEVGSHAMDYFQDVDLFCCLTNEIGKRALERHFNFRTIATIETMVSAGNADSNCNKYSYLPVTPKTRFSNFSRREENIVMFSADEEFRRWRFALHHCYSYHMMQTDSDEFAVMNKYCNKETNVRYGDIVDFETARMDENRLTNIMNCACQSLREEVDLVTIQAIPNSLLHNVSKQIGFTENKAKHYLCIKVKEPSNEYLYDSSRWLIKWGDYLR